MTHVDDTGLAARMAELARTLASPRSVVDVLSEVATAAKDLIPGVDAAGVLLIGKTRSFETIPAESDLAHRLHELQMEYDEGPCRRQSKTTSCAPMISATSRGGRSTRLRASRSAS